MFRQKQLQPWMDAHALPRTESGMTTEFAKIVAAALQREQFTLLDLGCSGGIDPAWRVFGNRFRALGIDASAYECHRLVGLEQHPHVHYRAAFVRMLPDHPAYRDFVGKPFSTHHPFKRTNAHRTVRLLDETIEGGSSEDKLLFNQWAHTELANEAEPISVEIALAERKWDDVDFIKIDIDNADFEVLTAIADNLAEWKVLGTKLEVNFFGGTTPTEATFHNTDRVMRNKGFTLVGLEPRSYSMSPLPARYVNTVAAQTHTGRVFQADAYYVLDLASDDDRAIAHSMSDEKLAKLAAIFSICNQPDSAAELMILFRDLFSTLLDVEQALDLLAFQTQEDRAEKRAYKDYIKEFEADSPYFYPRREQHLAPAPVRALTLIERLRAAWQAFSQKFGSS
ncbi:MAG: hypothetical protein Q8M19_08235 [Reyranella sp.]|nr:hypothetical protein [Reyranella sp.]